MASETWRRGREKESLQLQRATEAHQEQRPWQNSLYSCEDKGQGQWPLRCQVGHSTCRCWGQPGFLVVGLLLYQNKRKFWTWNGEWPVSPCSPSSRLCDEVSWAETATTFSASTLALSCLLTGFSDYGESLSDSGDRFTPSLPELYGPCVGLRTPVSLSLPLFRLRLSWEVFPSHS